MNAALKVKNDATSRFKNLMSATRLLAGWSAARLPKIYANMQKARWMSEGSSEGEKWDRLNPRYAAWKRKKYSSYPGAGKRMMIRTGELFFQGILPSGNKFRSIVRGRQVRFFTTLPSDPYFDQVNKARPFTNWSDKSKREIVADYRRYLIRGIARAR